jgi:ankyrin repeat protein
VKRGDSTVVKLLVDAGFKVNPRDRNGWTALGWARAAEAKGASPAAGAMLRLLRAAGARDDGGVQALALFDAIEKKDLASVKTALKAGANPNARDNSSVPLLVRAADLGQADIVSALIEAGAHLNVTPQFGASPLTAAIQNGSVETVKRLLAAGARSDQRDSKGQTPLMVSTIWSRKEIVSLLLADSVKVEPQALSMAAYKGDTSQLRMMLDHGGDPNSGRALIGAVRGCRARDNTPAIRMLLLRGARPQGNADYGLLHRAASSCPAEVLELLLQQGAELNGRDFFGATALMAAAKAGKISSVRVLIAAGADVHARNEDGMNAISMTRSSEVRQELLKAGARYLAERE